MKYVRLLFILPLLALVACDDDGITVNPVESAALVRVVNVAPQPSAIDLRFIDRVENLPMFLGVGFRGNSGAGYHRVEPGSRHLRVFPNSTDPVASSTRLVDQPSFNLAANERMTLVVSSQDGAHQVTRISEPHAPGGIPRAPAGQIAVKVLNAATGSGNVNVYAVPTATGTTGGIPANWRTHPDTHVFRNVGYLEATDHVNMPVMSGDGLYAFIVTTPVANDADAAILFFSIPNVPGTTAGSPSTAGPVPGVRIQESVLTAVLTPAPGGTVTVLVDRTLDPPWPSQQ